MSESITTPLFVCKGLLSTNLSREALYKNDGLTLLVCKIIPPPSIPALSVALSPSNKFLSSICTVVEFTVVVVPSTCKSPLIITLPPRLSCGAGSTKKFAGPFKFPVNVVSPNVGTAPIILSATTELSISCNASAESNAPLASLCLNCMYAESIKFVALSESNEFASTYAESTNGPPILSAI